LARRLVQALSEVFQVGLVFHGQGALEKSGLVHSSQRPWAEMGVDGRQSTIWREGHFELPALRLQLLDADLVVVDGSLDDTSPWILETDGEVEWEGLLPSALASLQACVGPRPARVPPGGVACFSDDDMEGLVEHIRERLDSRLAKRPLWGVLETDCGPDSPEVAAMGGLLARHTRGLLVRGAQAANWERSGATILGASSYPSLGRVGETLSLWDFDPHAAFFQVKLAGERQVDLEGLLARRDPLRFATVFHETQSHLPSMDAVIWEPKARARIFQSLAAGVGCPQRILVHSRIELVGRSD